ncbi:hypothetical protein CCO03_16775 [Comamonas serinivorans]|uniref:Uncharacterized protein n=1 Tax=Comamonas serinivorans TaxID=1082851 RepID=A0A1Y0ES71_9BURK|nr:hypothetical protein [Comamonas serinivorans]ARU06102.1 hypothetical protein CCO03_16775 [Comamonas serinivorans]
MAQPALTEALPGRALPGWAQHQAFAALFRAIAAPDLAERWLTLLKGKPSKWAKIQPWRCWPGDLYRNWPVGASWPDLRDRAMTQALQARAPTWHGLACGHGGPEVVSLPPADMRGWMDTLVEGFVVLVPGQLALIHNHEGGRWLWAA